MELSQHEYWSGLPFPPPGDLPDPGMEPLSSAAPKLSGGLSTTEPLGKLIIKALFYLFASGNSFN